MAETNRDQRRWPADGKPPPTAWTETPPDVRSASALLRESAGEARTVHFAGAGTKAAWGGAAAPADLTVRTTGLTELISHRPGDMTAAAGAGLPLKALQATLAEHGQWLAIDPASEAAGCTIGGLLATGEAGPRRLRYGTMRDLAIGATVVLADGTVAHSGSHVIKNVAGYDLTKLLHGSMGSLGLIGEVILRLHPRPAASATVRAVATAAQASAATWQLSRCGVEPSAIEWIGVTADDPAGALLVRVDGSPAGVAAGSERILSLLATTALAAERLDPATATACWAQVAGAAAGGPDDSVLRAGTLPDRLPLAAAALARRAGDHDVAASLASSTALGLHTAVLRGPAAAQVKAATAWRHDIVALGGAMSLRNRSPAVTAGLSALGDPPSSAALLRAVKHSLDPYGRCGPGRFEGWY